MLADERDTFSQVARHARLHPGHALARDVVDEAGAALDDGGDAFVRRGGCDEPDGAEAGVAHQLFVGVGFLGRQVEHEQSVHARVGGVGDELLHAAAVQEVEINVEDNRDFRLAPDFSDGRQELRRRGAALQAALGGELVHEAVRQRVAEGDAKLEDVHTRAVEGERELARGLEMGVTRADVNDEGLLGVLLEPGEAGGDAVHAVWILRLAGIVARLFDSQTRRSPSRVRFGSTAVISGSLEAINSA